MTLLVAFIATLSRATDNSGFFTPRRLAGEGITSPCTSSATCIKEEPWQCWYGYNGERPANGNNCRFSFKATTGRQGWTLVAGATSKMSFCAADTNGQRTSCDAANDAVTKLDLMGCWETVSTTTDAVMPAVKKTVSTGFSIAACYCPNINSDSANFACDEKDDYTIEFGRIYVWIAKICDHGNAEGDCATTPYMRAFPHQFFSLRLECPQNGCLSSENNLIKFTDFDEQIDRPNWTNQNSERTGCQQNAGSSKMSWLDDSGVKHGGASSNFKIWKDNQFRVAMPTKSRLDICYCNENCHVHENYFKVGELRTAETFSFASKAGAAADATAALSVMMKPGTITMLGGLTTTAGEVFDPRGGNKWSHAAAIKVISLDRLRINGWTVYERKVLDMDTECDSSGYQNYFWHDDTGPTTGEHRSYNAYPSTTWDGLTPSEYLPFDGIAHDKLMIMSLAGTYAVCYCAILAPGTAENSGECVGSWVHATNMVVGGPVGRASPFYSSATLPEPVHYEIPLDLVFDLEIDGYAFESTDKLRIVPASTDCGDLDELDPDGLTTQYKVACDTDTNCHFAVAKQNLDVFLMDATSTGVKAMSAEVFVEETVITFDGDITNHLVEGDTVTFTHESVKVITEESANWDDYRLFQAMRFTGIFLYPDDPTKYYLLPNTVRYKRMADGSIATNQLVLGLGYTGAELDTPVKDYTIARANFFTFKNNAGMWTRRNKMKTNLELKAVALATAQNLCWGTADNMFYSQAAKISFVAPEMMVHAAIGFSTSQSDTEAPIVLSFVIGKDRTRYSRIDGVFELVISFKDSQGKLKPRLIQSTSTDFVTDKDKKTQVLCGKMFSELWTNDDEGFPMPEACYFTPERKDAEDTASHREFILRFFFNNKPKRICHSGGIPVDCHYHLVISAVTNSVEVGDNLVDVFTTCRGCSDGTRVIERGQMNANMKTYPKSELSRFADTAGILIKDTMDGIVNGVADLSETNMFEVKIKGQDGNFKIAGGSYVRVFLMPLTQWTLVDGDCKVDCITTVTDGSVACETSKMTCVTKEIVVGSGRFNTLEAKLPQEGGQTPDFTPITSQPNDQHSLRFSELTRPKTGFFGTKFGFEVLARDDDTTDENRRWHPHYMESDPSVLVVKKLQNFGAVAKIVYSGRVGSGSRSFIAENNNDVFVSIRIPAMLIGSEFGTFTIQLPTGFGCNTDNNAKWDETELPLWLIRDNKDNQKDHALGALVADAGSWTYDGHKCQYTIPNGGRIYAGQILLLKLRITNVGFKMRKSDSNNVWSLLCTGRGGIMMLGEFLPLAEEVKEKWSGRIAVLDTLENHCIQPTPAIVSSLEPFVAGSTFFINVFFKTQQSGGRYGYVVLDAPLEYRFADPCIVMDLEEAYYAYQGSKAEQVKKIMRTANVHECYTSLYAAWQRLKIRVGGFLIKDFLYAFRAKIIAPMPAKYDEAQHSSWFIWTMTADEHAIDGTPLPVKFNIASPVSDTEFYQQGFGLYGKFITGVQVGLTSMSPYSLVGDYTWLTVTNLRLSRTRTSTLRVTAPEGYHWRNNAGDFEKPSSSNIIAWPANPTVYAFSTLLFAKVAWLANNAYQFRTRVKVPEKTPSSSTNAIYFEFGYDETSVDDATDKRLGVAVVELLPVKAIINGHLSYASNVKGIANNKLVFTLQLITAIPEPPAGIGIVGDANTAQFVLVCPHTIPSGAPPMKDFVCFASVDEDTKIPSAALKATTEGLAVGTYRFQLHINHPSQATDTQGTWTIGTYQDPVNLGGPIDAVLRVVGFKLNDPMPEAGIILKLTPQQSKATGRDDRPGKENHLIFNFTLSRSVASTRPLTLRAPYGFYFSDDCLDNVVTLSQDVFGTDTIQDFDRFGKAYFWPKSCLPTACTGSLNVADITIPDGLEAEKPYIFRVGVLANPTLPDSTAMWSIEFNGESSQPFPSFDLWTFSQAAVVPVATTAATEAPIQIFFAPFNEIPYGGVIVITAAEGFELLGKNNECIKSVYGIADEEPMDFNDFKCELLPDGVTLYLYSTNSIVKLAEKGKRYRLVVKVRNPDVKQVYAGVWEIVSYKSYTGSFGSIHPDTDNFLDMAKLVGFAAHSGMTIFRVCQTEGGESSCDATKRNGGEMLKHVIFSMQFPDDVKAGDTLQMEGPQGFKFVGGADMDRCVAFAWVGDANPFMNVIPNCHCDADICHLKFVLDAQSLTLQSDEAARFVLDMKNSKRTPDWAHNFWKMTHLSSVGEVQSRSSFEGWQIIPQLEFTPQDIQVSGANKAAWQQTSLDIQFTTVSSARSLRIQVLEPPNFDFDHAVLGASMESGFTLSQKNTTGNVITVFGKMLANQRQHFSFDDVTLGEVGGITKWSFTTFLDLYNDPTDVTNERLNMDGFRLPGRIAISSQAISSEYASQQNSHPIKSFFKVRVNEEATLEFQLMFSRTVYSHGLLRIRAIGEGKYSLQASPFVIVGIRQVEASVVVNGDYIEATLLPRAVAGEEVAFVANSPYQVFLKGIPLEGASSANTRWLFETLDGGNYPTNTNDGLTPGFSPVGIININTNAASRSPPKAEVEILVTLSWNNNAIAPTRITLIAPRGFSFPVGLTGCGVDCSIGTPFGSNRQQTVDVSFADGAKRNGVPFTIYCVTPMITPSDLSWYVVANLDDDVLGWGEAAGFEINQMRNVQIIYPAIEGRELQRVVFTFTTSNITDANQILIEEPPGFVLYCSEGAFDQISLPGNTPDCTDRPMTLTLNEDLLPETEYALQLGIDTAVAILSAAENIWNIIIKDFNFVVIDARYGIPGPELIPYTQKRTTELPMLDFTLAWNQAVPGLPSTITVGITFDDDTRGVAAILIELPDTLEHHVKSMVDAKNLNKLFPVSPDIPTQAEMGSWLDFSRPGALKIYVARGDSVPAIPAGTYTWEIKVKIPCCDQSAFPQLNFWLLSACADDSCWNRNSESVLATFPQAGFKADVTGTEASLMAGASRARADIAGILALLFLVFSAIIFIE
eukprot:GEMP01000134.1.p1 GENE.GEMP01000134.1~~GEMP01000134.1.p1  ORF type:complete len:2985 (+),score=568.53 GEMP01000134.1:27-8981(+)